MGFVFPWFIVALIGLAIPIIIHLFYFRKFKKVYFPNVEFLKEIKEEKNAVDRLKKLLVLASRILTLLFLVLAFTQPFIKKKKGNLQKGNTAVCIYIDNSYSMGLERGGESQLAFAKEKAIEIASAYDGADKLILLTNDFEGKHQHWMGKEDFTNFVDQIQISSRNKTIHEVIEKQKSLFDGLSAKNKEVYILSDFQRYISTQVTDTGFHYNVIPFQSNTSKNIFIDSCWFSTPLQGLNTSLSLIVQLRSSGKVDKENIRISLKINGKIKTVTEVTIGSDQTLLDTLTFSVSEPGWQEGELSFNDYPITFDDKFCFTFNVNQRKKILHIEGGVAKPYIRSVFKDDVFYQVETAQPQSFNADKLADFQLVILNELSNIPGALHLELKTYLENGGSLYIIPAENADLNTYNMFLSSIASGKLEPIESKQLVVKSLNSREAIFSEAFESFPKNMEMPKVQRYFPISGAISSGQNTLLELNNGRPLVSKYQVGSGYVYLQAVPLGNAYSNLGASPIFPPMVYNMGIFNAAHAALYYTIGKNSYVELENKLTNTEGVYKMSNGNFEFIPAQRPAGKKVILNLGNELQESGIYNVMAGTNIVAKMAFNYDQRESEMIFDNMEEIQQKFPKAKTSLLNQEKSNLTAKIKKVKEGIVLWKLCLIFALLFLAVETFILRFFK